METQVQPAFEDRDQPDGVESSSQERDATRPARMGFASAELRAVIEALPYPVSVHEIDGRVLCANKTLADLYGETPESMTGHLCHELFHDEDGVCPHELALSTCTRAESEGRLSIGGRIFAVAVHPAFGQSGESIGYLRLMLDQTDREVDVKRMLAAERYATLGQMVAGLAHDVGTPLNIISGYAEYLLMRSKPDSPGYKELSTILQQSRRIADFIRRMLDLARPSEGRTDAIGLEGFLAESLELVGHHLRKSDVKASLICNISPPLIYGDAPRLRQAFVILLMNARLLSGRGGAIEVVIDESKNGPDFVSLSLRGTNADGTQIDFSRLWSGLSDAASEDIAGLGLTLARVILADFGANIAAAELGVPGMPLSIDLPRNCRTPLERAIERSSE
ncbi:MAG TPA: histidine kinase dimerization/phospho-acceptor domain-containing protein [Blastocatellia bacterium]|nr:histidine kinase dimerization/phospho-acceptor domain-containing protein [Blastocatellia bacterium]